MFERVVFVTLSNFTHSQIKPLEYETGTHQDTWTKIRDHFTEEQWEVIEDALVSPHYFA